MEVILILVKWHKAHTQCRWGIGRDLMRKAAPRQIFSSTNWNSTIFNKRSSRMDSCALISFNRYISIPQWPFGNCLCELWEFYCDVTAGAAYFSVARTKVGTFEWRLIISSAFYNVQFFFCCFVGRILLLPRQRAQCWWCDRLQNTCAMESICSWIQAENNCLVKCE